MPTYEVEFCDGKRLVRSASTAAEAKASAKLERRAHVPPDTPRSAAEVKVARVHVLEDDARATR